MYGKRGTRGTLLAGEKKKGSASKKKKGWDQICSAGNPPKGKVSRHSPGRRKKGERYSVIHLRKGKKKRTRKKEEPRLRASRAP